jgi:hypothetical protein
VAFKIQAFDRMNPGAAGPGTAAWAFVTWALADWASIAAAGKSSSLETFSKFI